MFGRFYPEYIQPLVDVADKQYFHGRQVTFDIVASDNKGDMDLKVFLFTQ